MLEEEVFVPTGWTLRPLASCVEVLDRFRRPVNSKERANRQGDIPYYGATGQVGWIDDFLFDEELVLIGEDGAPFLDKSKPIAYLIEGKGWVNNHAHVLRARSEITSNRYIKYYMDAFDFTHRVQGSTRDKLTQGSMNTIPVLLAPRAQQDALVNALRKVDSRRQNSLDHIDSAQRVLDRCRSAALSSAYKQAAGEKEEFVVPLNSVLREPFKNGYSARPVANVTAFRVLTLTATTSGYFDGRHFKYTDESFDSDSPFWLCPGDILIQRGNTEEYVGVPALYEGEPHSYLYPDLMIRARVREDIDPRFVWYMLLAPQARQYLRDRATGSAGNMPKINQKVLSTVPVPLPNLEERAAIVERLDAVLQTAATTEGRIQSASLRVERSAQAVLAKAFRGELSITDPVAVGVGN